MPTSTSSLCNRKSPTQAFRTLTHLPAEFTGEQLKTLREERLPTIHNFTSYTTEEGKWITIKESNGKPVDLTVWTRYTFCSAHDQKYRMLCVNPCTYDSRSVPALEVRYSRTAVATIITAVRAAVRDTAVVMIGSGKSLHAPLKGNFKNL